MLGGMKTPLELKRKFVQLWPHLNERTKRIVAAEEAVRLGYGGVSLVSRACGLSRVTITKAIGGSAPVCWPPGAFGDRGPDGANWWCVIPICRTRWRRWSSL